MIAAAVRGGDTHARLAARRARRRQDRRPQGQARARAEHRRPRDRLRPQRAARRRGRRATSSARSRRRPIPRRRSRRSGSARPTRRWCPASVDLPNGVTTVLALPALSGPVLVAYGPVTPAQKAALIAAAASFKGDATVAGFRGGDADAVRTVARRFSRCRSSAVRSRSPRSGCVVGDLVEGRTLPRSSARRSRSFAIAPSAR